MLAALERLGLPHRVSATVSLEHARALARETLGTGELAAALGGDGLVAAVGGVLRGTDGVLGVLAGGRGNDFARKLGIPRDPALACALLAGGRERRVDVGLVGGRPFLGIASAGLDSDVGAIAAGTRLPLGGAVYAYAALRALARWTPARWEVRVDGDARSFVGFSVAVANTGIFGGGMRLAPRAALDDGLLDVVLAREVPRAAQLVNLMRVFHGTHLADPAWTLLRGREVAFAADRPFAVWADGDPIAPLPATVGVAPGALRVLVP